MRKILSILFIVLMSSLTMAQQKVKITILSDAEAGQPSLIEPLVIKEIKALMQANYELSFEEIFIASDVDLARAKIAEVYNRNQADVVIATGIITSSLMKELGSYSIPSISAINIDAQFDAKAAQKSTSGVSNFTFLQTPFSVENDIKVLSKITSGGKLAVFVDPGIKAIGVDMQALLAAALTTADFQIFDLGESATNALQQVDESFKGVYVLSPLTHLSSSATKQLFDGFISKGIPAFSLIDEPMLSMGAYAAFSSSENLKKMPRRIAIDVSKIAEGKNASEFPVQMESFSNQLLINMETVNKVGVYPNWDLIDQATLVNLNKVNTERSMTLKSAIAEGLENNLSYQIAQKETEIKSKNVAIANSNYLPQINLQSTGLFLDQATVDGSLGTKGTFNWTGQASLSQLILSEPAMANIAIQKLLLDSQEEVQRESKLDVILEVVTSYFNYLQVQTLTELRNQNVDVKNQNLKIAINKEELGYSANSDVYRWETELALAKSDYNQAYAQLNSVRYQLNQILNQPVDAEFKILDYSYPNDVTSGFDDKFIQLISNAGDLKRFGDFMVAEALSNLPEMGQIEMALAAQERLLQSKNRSMFLPSVALVANYDIPFQTVDRGDLPPIPGLSPNTDPTWNAALVAQFPIFTGGFKRSQQQQTKIGLYQLNDQRQDVENKLELQVRANLEQLNAAYNNLRLSKIAADAATKNINIMQELYKEGQVNVTTLIDAQNAVLGAQINAANAVYQFMIDLFGFQRSTGTYPSLGTEDQLTDLTARFIQYLNQK